jgi:hypothetical protein
MDSLPDDEIEGIWFRLRKYIDINSIEGLEKDEIAAELDARIRRVNATAANPQARGDFLADRGFARRALDVEPIYSLFYVERIRRIKITSKKGKQFHRMQYKGAPIKLSDGKTIRSGHFVKGKSEAEAIEHLKKRKA